MASTNACTCPSCQRPVQAPFGLAGTLVRCPKCNLIFWATDGTAPARDTPPPARRLAEEDPRPPWERPGFVRRDCEPHRAGPLAFLGTLAMLFGVSSLCFCIPAIIALPLGTAVWVAARRDLAKMYAGEMDPDGRGRTESARDMALGGVLSGGIAGLFWGIGVALHWLG